MSKTTLIRKVTGSKNRCWQLCSINELRSQSRRGLLQNWWAKYPSGLASILGVLSLYQRRVSYSISMTVGKESSHGKTNIFR